MTVRDLPGILRVIGGMAGASVIVIRGQDAVSFALSDLDVESTLALKSVLYGVYLRRGRSAVLERLARKRSKWNWFTKAYRGLTAMLRSLKRSCVSLSERLSESFSEPLF